jgi:hypothetical protein
MLIQRHHIDVFGLTDVETMLIQPVFAKWVNTGNAQPML